MSDSPLSAPIATDDHGLVTITGPDTVKFLQGQMTCDIQQLAINDQQSKTTLGAHCNPKGRMLFSFRACQLAEDTVALQVYKALIPAALGALKKYSVFSKVELADVSGDYQFIGCYGEPPKELSHLFPKLPEQTNHSNHSAAGVVIKLAEEQYEFWLKREQADINYAIDNNYWALKTIQNGIGEVRTETTEEFIPQMLNYQAVGDGISFKKGCYTGQEVVARMQYLGKLKRRMYRFSLSADEPVAPGTPLFTKGSEQSIGNVVIAAKADNDQELLAVVTETAVEQDAIYLDTSLQQKLLPLSLPYAITKE